jgi:hypothetical protein
MNQISAREADGRSASQGFARFLRNPKIHYNIYKSLPLSPISKF